MLPEVGNATFLVYTLQKELKWENKRQSDLTTDLDRPLEVQEVEARRISRKLAYDSSKAVSPMHQLPLCAPHTPHPQEIFMVLISVTCGVDPTATVLPEGLC